MRYKVHEVKVSPDGIRMVAEAINEKGDVNECRHKDPISNKELMEWFDREYRSFFATLPEPEQTKLIDYVEYLHKVTIPGFVKKILLMQYLDDLRGVK